MYDVFSTERFSKAEKLGNQGFKFFLVGFLFTIFSGLIILGFGVSYVKVSAFFLATLVVPGIAFLFQLELAKVEAKKARLLTITIEELEALMGLTCNDRLIQIITGEAKELQLLFEKSVLLEQSLRSVDNMEGDVTDETNDIAEQLDALRKMIAVRKDAFFALHRLVERRGLKPPSTISKCEKWDGAPVCFHT